MKSKVLDRPMFKNKGGEIDPENVGIMQGFKDMLGELEIEDDMEEEKGGVYGRARRAGVPMRM